jgi:hypothetical protein
MMSYKILKYLNLKRGIDENSYNGWRWNGWAKIA